MSAALSIAGIVLREMVRRKDVYVLLVLTVLITFLMGAQSIFDDDAIVRYLKEICLLLIWLSALFIAAATAARQIPAERENRTILPLLAKPVTRGQVIVGKFLGCWIASGLSLLVFYLFFTGFSVSRGSPVSALYFQAFWMHWMMLAVIVAMVLLGSLIFTSPSAAATICLILGGGILLLGRHLGTIAAGLAEPGGSIVYGVYFLIPHLEFFDLRELVVHDWDAVAWWAIAAASLYAAAYAGIFLLGAWLTFRKQSLV